MVVNLGIAAFWLAVGAWFVAMALSPWLRQREIQRTIRVMIERDGKIDADTLEMIKGKGADTLSQQDPQATEDFGRRMFGAGIFGAGLFLGFFTLMFLLASPSMTGIPPVGRFFWGAGSFIVFVGVAGLIAYHVAKRPKPPKAGD